MCRLLPKVFPTRKNGSPEENPSNNIVSVFGRRYSAIRCLCGFTSPSSMGASRNSTLISPNLAHPDTLPSVTIHSERAQSFPRQARAGFPRGHWSRQPWSTRTHRAKAARQASCCAPVPGRESIIAAQKFGSKSSCKRNISSIRFSVSPMNLS